MELSSSLSDSSFSRSCGDECRAVLHTRSSKVPPVQMVVKLRVAVLKESLNVTFRNHRSGSDLRPADHSLR